MSDVPARRETTALRKLIAPHVSEVNGTQCWWCSFCRGEWFDDEGEVHTDNCPYVAAEAELAAIERQREELRQDAEAWRDDKKVLALRAEVMSGVAALLGEHRSWSGLYPLLDELCNAVAAARLSAPPAATEKDDE